MSYPKEIYDPNFVPDGILEPGDSIPFPFGRNATVTDYFVVKRDNKIMTLYGYGDLVAADYGEICNVCVIGGNVIAKGRHILLQDIRLRGGSIMLKGSFITSTRITNLGGGK